MSYLNIGNLRLHHQQVSQHLFDTPEAVVGWMGAMQGQGYSGVKWSIGLRLPNATDNQIEQAILDKRIVRTWFLRDTLHIVAARDLHWMLRIVSEKLKRGNGARHRELELDSAVFAQSNDILANAVQGDTVQTRDELFALLNQQGIVTTGQRGIHILHQATLEGILCQGVMQGKNATFYAMDTLKDHDRNVPIDEALALLAQRYFSSHGPATLADLCRWAGITKREGTVGFEAVRSQFVVEKINTSDFIFSDTNTATPSVYLLSDFDEFILGYGDRSHVLIDPSHLQRIVPGGNGVFYPTVVADGRVVGTWKRLPKKNAIVIEITPFERLPDDFEARVYGTALRFTQYHQMETVTIQIG